MLWHYAIFAISLLQAAESPKDIKLKELYDAEIEQYEMALARRNPKERKLDLYIRLTETYFERYRMEWIKETSEGLDHTLSKNYLVSGIKSGEEAVRIHLFHQKIDHLYLILAMSYRELDRKEESRKYFQALIRDYPKSEYAPEAYKEIAEASYEKGEFREAVNYYQSAIRSLNDSKQVADSSLLSKLAWSYFRLKQFDSAVAIQKEALQSLKGKPSENKEMRQEILQDLAFFMTQAGKLSEAMSYFRNVYEDQTEYLKLLEKLAEEQERTLAVPQAIAVYDAIIRSFPDSPSARRSRIKLIELDLKRGAEVSAARKILGMKKYKSADADMDEMWQKIRTQLRKKGIQEHDVYRKNKNQTALLNADLFYSSYVKTFELEEKTSTSVLEVQMYLAELKREEGRSSEAATLYQKILKSSDERYARQAGVLWMVSLSEAIRKAKADSDLSDLQNLESEYVQACKEVIDRFGKTPTATQARLSLAQVYAGSAQNESKAVDLIREILDSSPRSRSALTAALLWIQIAEDQGMDPLKKSVEVIEGNLELMTFDKIDGSDQIQTALNRVKGKLQLGEVKSQVASKNYGAAGANLESLADREKKKNIRETNYESAILNYSRAEDFDSVHRVLAKWAEKDPRSPKHLQSVRFAATQSLVAGQYERSASFFRYLSRLGDPSALELSGRIYEGSGNLTESTKDFKEYLLKFPKGTDRSGVALSLASWSESSRNFGQAKKYYSLCFTERGASAAECGARLADLTAGSSATEAKGIFRQVSDRRMDSPWTGYARFRLMEFYERENSRRARRLRSHSTDLARALKERTHILTELSKMANDATNSSGPWSVAALDLLAKFVKKMADELALDASKSSPPSNLIAPLVKQADETWKKAAEIARQNGLLSPLLPEISDRLSAANPQIDIRAQGVRDNYRIAGVPVDGGSEGMEPALNRVRKGLYQNPRSENLWIDYGNILWGQGKPLLAKVAYERALILNSHSIEALNNRAILILGTDGQDSWDNAWEAQGVLQLAQRQNAKDVYVSYNIASLYNYYRLFKKALPYWEYLATYTPQADVWDGLAIAQAGLQKSEEANQAFQKAEGAGADVKRLAKLYSIASASRSKDPAECLKKAKSVNLGDVLGFEKESWMRLKRDCSAR